MRVWEGFWPIGDLGATRSSLVHRMTVSRRDKYAAPACFSLSDFNGAATATRVCRRGLGAWCVFIYLNKKKLRKKYECMRKFVTQHCITNIREDEY